MMRNFIIILLFFPVHFCSAQNDGALQLKTAKFSTGDSAKWSQPDFNDRYWKEIVVGKVWQAQGYDEYHGYAWYRIHVVIPSSLKKNALWKDSLRIYLAHVNDVDETFLNGVKIGHIGKFPFEEGGYVSKWPAVREYHLSSAQPFIRWDEENIIAVRVYDGGGTGGIFMGTAFIDMLEKNDGIDVNREGLNFISDKKAQEQLKIVNRFNTTVRGTFAYKIVDARNHRIVSRQTITTRLKPFETLTEVIRFPHQQGIEVSYAFMDNASKKKKTCSYVVPYILTPPESPLVHINGPSVFGLRPGSPFFYKIPVTGKAPIEYGAEHLPGGLSLNSETGILTGSLSGTGDYEIILVAKNALSEAKKRFTIKVGDVLALTPPMGWNSWNCWGINVSQEKVKSSAQAMIEKGLMNHGWMYINIDDGWEAAQRAANGEIVANEKFPDLKSLGNFLHDHGLRLGIYTSPGPKTCGGYLGSYQHELRDATTYAQWGVDYLKYDLCSYSDLMSKEPRLEEHQRPYKLMGDDLKRQKRDIVYSLCQYGIEDVWKWGEEMNGNLWRTTEDITDTWSSLYEIGFSQYKVAAYAKPGRWNDPDMLIVGMVGWGENLHPTRLTPHEQYTHISLWSLLSAPLLIGCDLSRLDAFTLNLLTNDEVISIDQDSLGKSAVPLVSNDRYQVWVKELHDGSRAIGLFNTTTSYQTIKLPWQDIRLHGPFAVTDVWRQKNLGIFQNSFSTDVPAHGVMLIKVRAVKKTPGMVP